MEAVKIISRAEAKALGLKRYFTGTACKNGGVAERSTGNGECHCNTCLTARRGRKNDSNKKFRAENRELMLKREREYYHRNGDHIRSERAKWHKVNAERLSQKGRSPAAQEAARVRALRWKNENPEKHLEIVARRRANKRLATPAWYSEFDSFVFQEAKNLSWIRRNETGVRWDVDHLIPLSAKTACGLHCAENFQVIPSFLNLMKGSKMIITNRNEWVRLAWAR